MAEELNNLIRRELSNRGLGTCVCVVVPALDTCKEVVKEPVPLPLVVLGRETFQKSFEKALVFA